MKNRLKINRFVQLINRAALWILNRVDKRQPKDHLNCSFNFVSLKIPPAIVLNESFGITYQQYHTFDY